MVFHKVLVLFMFCAICSRSQHQVRLGSNVYLLMCLHSGARAAQAATACGAGPSEARGAGRGAAALRLGRQRQALRAAR